MQNFRKQKLDMTNDTNVTRIMCHRCDVHGVLSILAVLYTLKNGKSNCAMVYHAIELQIRINAPENRYTVSSLD